MTAAIPLRVLRGEVTDFDTDEGLVAGLRRGDTRAELAAWNRFSARVDATLRRLLGPGQDPQGREDLLQEVFIRFFSRVGTLRVPAAVGGFLTGITVHVVHGELARRRRRSWLRLTTTGVPPDVASPPPCSEAREAVLRYYQKLDLLSPKDRSIFVARTIEGLTLAEVASVHGLSVSTAQRRLLRATKKVSLLVRRDPVLAGFADKQRAEGRSA
jgi:RNA polymerase sigma factor (sigma-70 family)